MHDLPVKTINRGELLQHVSRTIYRSSDLYFGNEGANRYDDPARTYGVTYLGFDLPTALMESVFHQHRWHLQHRRTITRTETTQRLVRAVGAVQPLILADLTAPGVMAAQLGLNLSQIASRRYQHTQRISRIVHATADDRGRPTFDGLLYPSRNNYPASCVALFDRAASKVRVVDDIDLVRHIDWPVFVRTYRITILPA
jgi:RES domain